MLKKISYVLKNRGGFTLVELMVVVLIIGILAAIAVPVYNGVQEKAANNAHSANVRILKSVAAQFIAENPGVAATWDDAANTAASPPATGADDGWEDYLESWPAIPDGATSQPAGVTGTLSSSTTYKVVITTAGVITITTV